MEVKSNYNVAIIGGGLAGLTLAVQLADAGISCVLFEKNKYPFHKVCGEYISMESWNFLERLGVDLKGMDLPKINRLEVSSPSGKLLKHDLDPGGFGISRYLLDDTLARLAREKMVKVLDDCRVRDIRFAGEQFIIDTEKGSFQSEICVGSWGKKSNLDTKLKRAFIKKSKTEKNYVGIKHHVQIDLPADVIALHNFENGYCGISKVEKDRYCLCYLTDSDNLKKYNGNIRRMEEDVLMKNLFLKKHFDKAAFLFAEPLAISQIRIGYKSAVEGHVLMVGDTAGNIAPLSGNGMSMAMRSSFELGGLLSLYFKGKIDREKLEKEYAAFWKKQFRKRVELSVVLQKLLKNTSLTDLSIAMLKRLPLLRKKVIRSTHGKPF